MVPPGLQPALDGLRGDLAAIFGPRLRAIVAYGSRLRAAPHAGARSPLNTLALVDRVAVADLQACASRASGWRRDGLAMPLVLGERDFARSLDVFPFEYGDIIARHIPVFGSDPFAGLQVSPDELRRGCEAQAKSHLIHLRGGFLEAGGRGAGVADLVLASAVPFETLLGHVTRLRGGDDTTPAAVAQAVGTIPGVDPAVVRDVVDLVDMPRLAADDALRLYPAYLESVERLVEFLDGWTQGGRP